MRPRPEDQPLRARQALERAERVVAVPVGPAGDDHRGTRDRLVVDAERAMPPVVVEALVLEPREHPRLRALEAARPLLAPTLAVDRRRRGQRVARDHVARVVDLVELLHDAALEVHVVAEPVVGRVDRDDRLQCGRAFHRDLDAVEPGVGVAVHPDRTERPRPGREPVDHRGHVGAFDRRVLVGRDAFARAGAANVDAAHHVAGLGEAPVLAARAPGDVVLAVGERLEHGRPRPLAHGHVDGRGEPDAVGHLDRDVLLARDSRARHGGEGTGAGLATGRCRCDRRSGPAGYVQPRNQTRAFHIVSEMRLAVRIGHIHRNSPTAAAT